MGPSADKMVTGSNFIRAVLQTERSVNGLFFSNFSNCFFFLTSQKRLVLTVSEADFF